jgi:hypothetical protein
MIARIFGGAATLSLTILFSSAGRAQTPTFTMPDAALPAAAGTGLSGRIWSSALIEPVDDLTLAREYLVANPTPDATFLATTIDYPNGAVGSTSTDELIAAALGVDAASLSDPTVGERPILNTILRMQGFLRVNAPGTQTIGVGSDDGSELLIQGVPVITNDGLHSFPGAGPVDVEFTAAGLYAVEVLFFESQSSAWGLELYFDAPESETSIPTELLYPVPEPGLGAFAWAGCLALVRVRGRLRRGR